jgi:hypothetical protein
MGIDHSVEFYCNPCRTDWESFRTDLAGYLHIMKDGIANFIDLEPAARQFQDAVIQDTALTYKTQIAISHALINYHEQST